MKTNETNMNRLIYALKTPLYNKWLMIQVKTLDWSKHKETYMNLINLRGDSS
jgi:hypothetical protein